MGYHNKFEPDMMSYTGATGFQTISRHTQMARIFMIFDVFLAFLKQCRPTSYQRVPYDQTWATLCRTL